MRFPRQLDLIIAVLAASLVPCTAGDCSQKAFIAVTVILAVLVVFLAAALVCSLAVVCRLRGSLSTVFKLPGGRRISADDNEAYGIIEKATSSQEQPPGNNGNGKSQNLEKDATVTANLQATDDSGDLEYSYTTPILRDSRYLEPNTTQHLLKSSSNPPPRGPSPMPPAIDSTADYSADLEYAYTVPSLRYPLSADKGNTQPSENDNLYEGVTPPQSANSEVAVAENVAYSVSPVKVEAKKLSTESKTTSSPALTGRDSKGGQKLNQAKRSISSTSTVIADVLIEESTATKNRVSMLAEGFDALAYAQSSESSDKQKEKQETSASSGDRGGKRESAVYT